MQRSRALRAVGHPARRGLEPAIPTGGDIVPGLYVQSAYTLYTGTGGASGASVQGRDTFLLGAALASDGGAGGALQYPYTDTALQIDGTVYQSAGIYTFAGTTLNAQQTCPPGDSSSAAALYTATGNTITIVFDTVATNGDAYTAAQVMTLVQ